MRPAAPSMVPLVMFCADAVEMAPRAATRAGRANFIVDKWRGGWWSVKKKEKRVEKSRLASEMGAKRFLS